ncbi:radical SAM protein [Rhodopseudomonas sp. RCAM05734]|uniref:radical SAM protein n=1 Tax=Rhodopseudomonas sp. RCAM05734 TaxID=3457549 RepID=UPI004044081D
MPFTRELGFEITTRCPLECAHCIVDSGPWRRERASDELEQWLNDGAGLAGLDTVVATGGEPFLYPKALVYLAGIARRHECRFRVVTSASWAHTLPKATKMLSLVPVDHLVVSVDRYHEEFLPFEAAVNALRAALNHNISSTVNVCASVDELGHEVKDMNVRLIHSLGAAEAASIEITGQPILTAGRAKAAPNGSLLPWQVFDSCPMLQKHVVKTDGDVIACCGPPAYRSNRSTDWLKLGRLGKMPIAEILGAAERNWLVRAIHTLGPAFLYELGGEIASRLGDQFDTRCTLCVAALSDEEIMSRVIARLGEPAIRRRIALAAALKFGDLSLLENNVIPANAVTATEDVDLGSSDVSPADTGLLDF